MMKKELSVVVNKKDRIINYLSRETCHKNKILHRAVHIIILNSKNQVFVQKRSSKKDVFPGFLEASLSGHVIKRESYVKTAIRELKEEINVRLSPRKLIKLSKIKIKKDRENEIIQLFLVKDINKFKINKSEVSDGRFIDLNQFKKDIKNNKRIYTPASLLAIT